MVLGEWCTPKRCSSSSTGSDHPASTRSALRSAAIPRAVGGSVFSHVFGAIAHIKRRRIVERTRDSFAGMRLTPVASVRATESQCSASFVVGGVKPRINGEQHAPGTTKCSVGRQGVTSRQAATRLLRCAPALQVTRRNPLTRLVFMAGSELPAIADPVPRTRLSKMSTPTSCVRHLQALFRRRQQSFAATARNACQSVLLLEHSGRTNRKHARNDQAEKVEEEGESSECRNPRAAPED